MVTAGLLCAIGIVIPMFSPIKFLIEPASFTLGSHIAIFIAMFISPVVAVTVSLGTTFGFLLAGFPLVVVMRALTHVVFATVGGLYLRNHGQVLGSLVKSLPFSFVIGLLHAACEVLIVLPFYFGGMLPTANYDEGFITSVLLLVGIGTVIHSMVDFGISLVIWKPICKVARFPVASQSKQIA